MYNKYLILSIAAIMLIICVLTSVGTVEEISVLKKGRHIKLQVKKLESVINGTSVWVTFDNSERSILVTSHFRYSAGDSVDFLHLDRYPDIFVPAYFTVKNYILDVIGPILFMTLSFYLLFYIFKNWRRKDVFRYPKG